MNIQQLKNYWEGIGETLYVYSPSQVNKAKLNNETFSILTSCGLPLSAAPFLSFDEIQEGKLLTPNQNFKIDVEGLDIYLMFGCNGSGDPICIDTTKECQIVYLNHDNNFERVFINDSMLRFVVCLTKYRDFLHSLIDKTSSSFKLRKFSDAEFKQLKDEFKTVDINCLTDTSFWLTELDNLEWERDNE